MKQMLLFAVAFICAKSFSYQGKLFPLKGYCLIFSSNYVNDSVVIQNKKRNVVWAERITTNFSTGLTGEWYFFDSTWFNTKFVVRLFEKNTRVTIRLKRIKSVKFIEVVFYGGRLYCNLADKLPEAE